MATSEVWRRSSISEGLFDRGNAHANSLWIWIGIDVLTVVTVAVLATLFRVSCSNWFGPEEQGSSLQLRGSMMGILVILLCGFLLALVASSRRLRLYEPSRFTSMLHEQRLSVQACLGSGLLLTGALYLVHLEEIPRSIVLLTVGAVTVALSLRRLLYRLLLYRRFERGMGLRNVLIVGTGDEAQALGNLLVRRKNLGYSLQGFIALPGSEAPTKIGVGRVLGSVDSLLLHARRLFVDEIFLAAPCERAMVCSLLNEARDLRVDLRLVTEVFDGLTWHSPLEYVGEFPTIPLHRGRISDAGLLLKRLMDLAFSATVLLLLSPLLLLLAIAVKIDSPGPVFYSSERLGKKGRVFRCIKFRTMVQDAEKRLAEIRHLNERDGILFKATNDPRITRLGRFLRKYSLDELPQFFNVLWGEMSVVGPRPPLASEVVKYRVDHLRRLDAMPGITGLWQVQGRRDPSFESYVSLDVSYIENWSLWLDLAIILRTVGVVVAGTGS